MYFVSLCAHSGCCPVVRVVRGPICGARWIPRSSVARTWLGFYEKDTARIFADLVREGAVVYDIGANVGFYTLLASQLAGDTGRVFAFEPLPQNLDLLRRHVDLNLAKNVTVVAAAVAEAEGSALFAVGENHAGGFLADVVASTTWR